MRLHRLPLLPFLLACLLTHAVQADDDAAMRARVGRLLQQAESEGEDQRLRVRAWRELAKLGWERVLPLIDMRQQKTWEARTAALAFAREFGKGPSLYQVCLQAIRLDDERIVRQGLGLLRKLLLGRDPWSDDESKPRLRFDSRWWPELLLALHKTKVHSGSGFGSEPLSSILTELLTAQVHGQEAPLVTASRHLNWRVRMMALPILGATTTGRTAAVEDALRRALRDAHPKVRQMAVRTASSAEWHALVSDTGERLVDPSEAVAVRVEAAERLEDFEDKDAVATFLIWGMQSKAVPVRAASAAGAQDLKRTQPLVAALLAAFFDPEPSVRVGAANGLANWLYGPIVPAAMLVDTMAVAVLLDDDSPRVQHRASQILAERGAVPAVRATDLVARLTGESAWAAQGAALALASLRGAGRPALPQMQAARGKTPSPDGTEVPAWELERAIEAVEMAALDTTEVEALLAGDDEISRMRAVRELVRRDDSARLVRVLKHDDPDVAICAAWHLTDDEAHTEAVVDTVLRAFPRAKHYRAYHIFHRLGARLKPYATRALARYKRTPDDRWFGLLEVVKVLEPHLRELVWREFLRAPDKAEAKRVARLGETLMPRVLAAFSSDSIHLRRGAALAVANMREWRVAEHAASLIAACARLTKDDPARRILEAALRECDCEGGRPPLRPWIELR